MSFLTTLGKFLIQATGVLALLGALAFAAMFWLLNHPKD